MLYQTGGRRIATTASLLLLSASLLFSASALSVTPRTGGRRNIRCEYVVVPPPAVLFPVPPPTRRQHYRSATGLAVRAGYISDDDGKFHSAKKLALALFRRTLVIFSLALLLSKTPAVHAARSMKEAEIVTATAGSSSFGRRLTKLFVTAGAVFAGAATANRFRSFDKNDNDGDNTNVNMQDLVVPKEKPTPLPLSSEVVETPIEPKSKPQSSATKDPTVLINLDQKIEMLRAREESAKADAEKKRLEDMEKAAEVRKQEQDEIDAKIELFEQQQLLEQERMSMIKRQRAEREREEREQQLASLERGKKEQARLEQKNAKVIDNLNLAAGNTIDNDSGGQERQVVTGADGKPADSKEKDLELTRQIILNHINLEGEEDDEDDWL